MRTYLLSLLTLMLTTVATAGEIQDWHVSIATLAATSVLDIHSSYGLTELNPVIGRGQFGTRQVAAKSGIVAGVILAEYLIIRRYPHSRAARTFKWLNFGIATTTAISAGRNYRQ